MSDLLHHYKDRNPEETIQIIQKFFTARNCRIKCIGEQHSEADTYSCTYGVYWHGRKIQQANGKGATSLYAKASCFAELYERFCLYAYTTNMNKFIFKDVYNEIRLAQDNCKELNYIDILNENNMISILDKILPTVNKKYINEYLDIFFDGTCYGIPYTSLQNPEDIKYKNLSIIANYYGSTGFSAGNTLEEALVQAISEIFERYTIELFYNNLKEQYFYLEEDKLPIYIKTFIDNIRIDNPDLEIKLYDLSYNFGMPVCLLMINDPINHLFYFNFGSSPVFEIAAERCFTEMYQGCCTLPLGNKVLRRPCDMLAEEACLDVFKSAHGHENIVIPENLILKSYPIDSYNEKIFLAAEEVTNETLVARAIEIEKAKDLQLYYANISLAKDIYAVHVVMDECKILSYTHLFSYLVNLTEKERLQIFELTKYVMDCFTKAYDRIEISDEEIEQFVDTLITKLEKFDRNDLRHGFDFLLKTLNFDVYNIFMLTKTDTPDNYILFYNLITDLNNVALTEFCTLKHLYQNYMLYIFYKQDNYPDEIINHFFNFLGYRNLYDNDIQKADLLFIIKKVFVNSIYELYHSKEYLEFLTLFNKDNNV